MRKFRITLYACDPRAGDKPPVPRGGYVRARVIRAPGIAQAEHIAQCLLRRRCLRRDDWKRCVTHAASSGKPGPMSSVEPMLL